MCMHVCLTLKPSFRCRCAAGGLLQLVASRNGVLGAPLGRFLRVPPHYVLEPGTSHVDVRVTLLTGSVLVNECVLYL